MALLISAFQRISFSSFSFFFLFRSVVLIWVLRDMQISFSLCLYYLHHFVLCVCVSESLRISKENCAPCDLHLIAYMNYDWNANSIYANLFIFCSFSLRCSFRCSTITSCNLILQFYFTNASATVIALTNSTISTLIALDRFRSHTRWASLETIHMYAKERGKK